MTDKEKILAKIESLLNETNYEPFTDEVFGRIQILKELKSYIDSLQEEPVSNPIDFEKELYKAFGQVKDFALGMRIAKWFYDMGKNHQEPVSEDFKIALNKKLREEQDWTYIEEEGGECPLNEEFGAFELKEFAEWGAKWQREQFEKNRLKHCDNITEEQYNLETGFIDQHLDKHQRMPTFLDAIEYGMQLMKEQLMKDAFEFTKEHNTACVLASECLRNNGWFNRERDFNDLFRHLSCVDELFEGKFSGKTKVIVIKEDRR